METKKVYQLDHEGFLIGVTEADPCPLEPGVFLIPGGCVEAQPLPFLKGKWQKFEEGKFIYVDAPKGSLLRQAWDAIRAKLTGVAK